MKSILVLLVIVAVARAFQVSRPVTNKQAFMMMSDVPVPAAPQEVIPEAPKPKVAKNALWFPFGLKAPLLLDGTLAADAGFDPLRLGSGSMKTLYW